MQAKARAASKRPASSARDEEEWNILLIDSESGFAELCSEHFCSNGWKETQSVGKLSQGTMK